MEMFYVSILFFTCIYKNVILFSLFPIVRYLYK